MNFKQNSLFTRNTGYKEEPMESQGGVLAVWGSPSSGKTVVSVKLADYLARKKKNVLLIFADMATPPLPCICASSDLEGEKSLGSILAATHVTENLIKKNCMFYRKNDYLSMIGMLKGENVFTYPPYDQTQAAELIEQARGVAPYVIIDCGSTIASDVFPIVVFTKQLENKKRRLMEIMECEITRDGKRHFNSLFRYEITENRVEGDKFIINGTHQKVSGISESLKKRFLENGMPKDVLNRITGGGGKA